jgi:hypothetical protein
MNRNKPEPRDYFTHNAPLRAHPRDVIEWQPTGEVEHVEMWTDERGLDCHASTWG